MVMKRMVLLMLVFQVFFSLSLFAQQSDVYMNSADFKHALELLTNPDAPDEEGAMESLQKEVRNHPRNGWAHYYIGLIYSNHHKYGDALASMNKAVELLKKDKLWAPYAYRVRASVYLGLGNEAMALEDWKSALRVDPNDERTLFDRAEYYYQQQSYGKADADYEWIIKNNPTNEAAYMGKARNAIDEKKYKKAKELLDYAAKLDPENSKVYAFRAQAYMGLQKYPEAADDLVSALRIDERNDAFDIIQDWREPEMNVLLSKLKIQSLKDKKNPLWSYYIGIVYESNDMYLKAANAYQVANNITPSAVVLARMACCYSRQGYEKVALDAIDQAISMDSIQVVNLMLKGDILYDMGRGTEAIAVYDAYIAEMPDEAGGYYRRGFIKDNLHDVDGAIEDYTTSIMIDATAYPYAYLGRGDMYTLKGNKVAAVADYQKAIELDTEYGESNVAHYAYLALGQKDKAIAFCDSVLAHSESIGNLYDAACLYARMGNKEKSLDYLEASLEKGFRRLPHLSIDSDLDCLRNLPRYKELIRKYQDKAKEEERMLHVMYKSKLDGISYY